VNVKQGKGGRRSVSGQDTELAPLQLVKYVAAKEGRGGRGGLEGRLLLLGSHM